MAKILISGAGIGGPALAYWLRRGGHEVCVVERATQIRWGGQAVDLRGAGRTVVERMGLLPDVARVQLEQEGMSWVRASGRVRARMPADAFGGEGMISEIEVLRGDLARILVDASADVEYLYADSIAASDQDTDGVDVVFEGGVRRRFDLVVGADGVGSRVRRIAFGDAGWRPLGCVMAWFGAPDPGDLRGWYQMFNAPGGRVATLRPARVPGQAKASFGLRVNPGHSLPATKDAQQRLLIERFTGLGWRVPMLLDAMLDANDFAFTEVGQVRLDAWSRGRVVLLGDAAASPSPLTGLGTSVALVQAYVLAGELAMADGDHRRAFPAYERVTRSYVESAQELPGGGVAGYAPMSRFMIDMQIWSMRMMTRWPVRQMLERQFAKAGGIDLPDYPGLAVTPPELRSPAEGCADGC